jgi:hypothetical protein
MLNSRLTTMIRQDSFLSGPSVTSRAITLSDPIGDHCSILFHRYGSWAGYGPERFRFDECCAETEQDA